MNRIQRSVVLALIFAALIQAKDHGTTVTPDALPEARALLNYIDSISGKYILSGQHNYPDTRDHNSQFAARYIGKTPVVWSSDMGFAEEGDTDSYLARPDIIEEAIRQHKAGSLVTLCWHAVPPTTFEPVTFRPPSHASKDSLISVQGDLLDQQFLDLLTPGTVIYKRWCAQVDSVARYLKDLEKAKVPVLWRPYHEMNGGWFWWGGRTEEKGTRALYRQIFDRLVNYHQLKNLIWVWSVDRFHNPEMHYSQYYPGNDYLDILSLDVYGNDFKQAYYDSLKALSRGKPLVLGEVGNPPALKILDAQPDWAFWVVWAGMVRNITKKQYGLLKTDSRVLFLEDVDYQASVNSFRMQCELPAVKAVNDSRAYTGEWIFDETLSSLSGQGAAHVPYKLLVNLLGDELTVTKVSIVEWGADRRETETRLLDGTPQETTFRHSPCMTISRWNEGHIQTEVSLTVSRGGETSVFKSSETWSLTGHGQQLILDKKTLFRSQKQQLELVYHRR